MLMMKCDFVLCSEQLTPKACTTLTVLVVLAAMYLWSSTLEGVECLSHSGIDLRYVREGANSVIEFVLY